MKRMRILSALLAFLMILGTLSVFTGLTVFADGADETDGKAENNSTSAVSHNYISKGLYAWFCGAQNTANGQQTDASVWQDLVSGLKMTVAKDQNNYFTAEGLHTKAEQHYFPEEIVSLVNGNAFTVEIEFGDFTSIGSSFNTFMNSQNDNFALFRRNVGDVIEWKFGGVTQGARPVASNALENLGNHLITVTYAYGDVVEIYVDGQKKASAECLQYMGADNLFIGHSEQSKQFETTYQNIRFYSRALSEEEVLYNAAVDGHASIKDFYVQDGLVSLYSGVSNTANGYDAQATAWTDLVSGYDLPLTINVKNYFTNQGFCVLGDTTIQKFPTQIVDLVNGQEFTVEILLGDFTPVGASYGTIMNSANDNFALFRGCHDDRLSFKFGGIAATGRPFVDNAEEVMDNGLISITYKVNGKCRVYCDGVLAAEVECDRAMGADNLFIGQRDPVKTFASTYKSIRFYNRELTAEEVLANATADCKTTEETEIVETLENPGYVTVAQPVTKIVGDVAMVRSIGSAKELDSLVLGTQKPASAIYTIDKDLNVVDANGTVFSTVTDVLKRTEFKILSCFRIADKETADALSGFLSLNRFYDVQLLSADKEVLQYAREKMPNCYGILDMHDAFAGTTDLNEEQLLDIRRAVKTYNASVVILPVGLCSNEDVQYLYDRQVNVWAYGSDTPTLFEQYYALLSGAIGIVSDAVDSYLDIACNQFEENTMTRLPINIGHRGIPSKSPENSIEGAQYAYELGAEVIEIDVYLTKDNQAVLMHDATTGRTCNKDLVIAESTLEELTALYCNKGYERKERFKDAKVPSLDAFLAAFTGTDVRFYIEVKSGGETLAKIVKELIEKNNMYGQCSIISFNASELAAFRKIYPEMSVGGLCMAYMNGDNPESEFRSAMSFIGKYNATLNPRFTANGSIANYDYQEDDLRAALIRGIQIHPWTFEGKATKYESHFIWGYSGLTGNNADVFKTTTRKIALPTDISLTVGESTELSHILTTYARKEFVESGVTVKMISGDAVAEGNTITPGAAGEIAFITSSQHTFGKSTYTMYTQPVTLTVAADASTDSGATDTTNDPGQTTTDDTYIGKENKGCGSAVGSMLAVVALGAAVVLQRKKKEE